MKIVNSMVCFVKLDVFEFGLELKIRCYMMMNDYEN